MVHGCLFLRVMVDGCKRLVTDRRDGHLIETHPDPTCPSSLESMARGSRCMHGSLGVRVGSGHNLVLTILLLCRM